MVQDVFVVATGVLKRIRQYRHGAELTRLVHLPGKRDRGVGAPLLGESNRPEWQRAEHLTNQGGIERPSAALLAPVPEPPRLRRDLLLKPFSQCLSASFERQ